MAQNDFAPNLGAPTSPEAELDKLLSTSGAGGSVSPNPQSVTSGAGKPGLRNLLLYIGIGLLVAVVVGGTIWLVISLLGGAKGEVTFELNENQVELAVDGRSLGKINPGDTVKIKAGEHTLMLSKAGFLTIEESLRVESKAKKTLTYELLPVPQITKLVDGIFQFVRLSRDGTEVSYWDSSDKGFKTLTLGTAELTNLFAGTFAGVREVVWSPTTQAAIVRLEGRPNLARTINNRDAQGRYIPFGESPVQGPANFAGYSNWLFDDNLKPAAGWTPVALNDSIREVAFSADGGEAIYLYDPADGEYSLVRSLPDGREWERVIVEMPELSGAKLVWDASGRYLLAEAANKLYLVDVVSKTIQEIFQDRAGSSHYAFSEDGTKIAYLAKVGENVKISVYDLLTQEIKVLNDVEANDRLLFTWADGSDLLLAMPNQTFVRLDVERGKRTTIPFTGTDTSFQIREMQYSREGHVLMLVTDKGLFTIKV